MLATQPSATNSPFGRAATITGTGGGSQTISSIALSNNRTTTGLSSGTAVGTLSVTLSPITPTFPYSGTNLHLSTSGADSGGVCNTTNGAGNGSFQVGAGDTLQTNGALTAGNKAVCVAASESGAAPAGQAFTITVGNLINAATTFCPANGGGNGTSGSPWHYNCIQAAVNAAVSGDTVFLAGGNWVLDSGDASFVSINKAGITLRGLDSGNTFDVYGHINNAGGTTMCPTTGSSITCVKQTGTSYPPGQSANWKGFIRFGLDGQQAPNCVNETVANIFFDGSTTTAGGDYDGILAFDQCPGPITMTNIRVLTYQDAGFNGSTQLFSGSSKNVLLQNSMLGNPLSTINGHYGGGQAYESAIITGETVINNYWWQGVYNPTFNDNIVAIGNTFDMTQTDLDPAMGVTGCGLNPSGNGAHLCGTNAGTQGNFHATFSNNYLNSGNARQFAIGGAVNDWSGVPATSTTGNINDLHFTGNWMFGTNVALDACEWHLFNDQSNCANNGMSINALADTGCNLSNSGNPYMNTNNSLIGTLSSQLNAYGTGTGVPCFSSSNPINGQFVPAQVYNYTGQQNYLSSPSNQYNFNANTFNPTVTDNFCAGGTTFTQTDSTQCATTGFTTSPTASFTLGPLSGTIVPFTATNFTAQYGAVKWLASTSSTPPTSSGQSGTGAGWSFTPPIQLSGVAHGNTVFLWTMDSVNRISAAASHVVP
jgi:hypothetical protein